MLGSRRTAIRSLSPRSKPKRPEQEEQIALLNLVRWHGLRYPDMQRLFHCPNGVNSSKAVGGILRAMGLTAGVSDLLLLVPRRGYFGLAMEMKAPGKLGELRDDQIKFLCDQTNDGYLSVACDNATAGFELLVWYVTGKKHTLGREAPPGIIGVVQVAD